MMQIFLSYSRMDKNQIAAILNNLKLSSANYEIWYYNPASGLSMKEILERLCCTDLFILIASDNSLASPYVQAELCRAIELTKAGLIKAIYPILIDKKINIELDQRIPAFIKSSFSPAASPVIAAKLIEEIISKY